MTGKRRVVVTGMGILSPVGIGLEENWDNIVEGRSGIGPVTRFDCSNYPSRIAGEVKDFRPEDYMPQKLVKRLDPFV
ncbi:MAG TPA: beta-ketoacyl-[acyl-carrier-protein] synthase II, partial [Dissulfuribacter thermophilus]|nr:beta-ketoacyl-[acyl-carrier-protein] synthase II [Dissulfuribacter thermophilus]